MEHQVKKLEKSEVEITVTVTQEEFEKYRKTAIEQLGKKVKVDGFRPGHVPAHVLESKLGAESILYKTQDIALQKTYPQIVLKEELQVVSAPKIKIESEENPFKYTATVALMPEIELKDYKSIKVKKDEVKVSDKDVQEVVDDLLNYITSWKDVDRKAKKGDRAELEFEGFDKGEAVEGTKSSHHPVILGKNTMIPGFEDEVIGMKVDEEKEFDITFPEKYHSKEFQGRKLKFKIKLQRLEEPTTPELDEESIEKLTGKKQKPEELKKDIEKNLKERKEMEARQKQENEYIEELIKKAKVEIPKSLIDEEVHYIIHDMKSDVESKGIKWEQFMEQSKSTHEDLHKKYEPEAERRIKMRLALQHLIKEEKIEVSEEEFKKEFEAAKAMNHGLKESELANQIKNRLALRQLFDKVLG